MERKSGVDIFRIMCCIGVLNYHVMDDILTSSYAMVVYFASSFCIPGFFLMSGYLLANKGVTIDYCEKKIWNTVLKLFGWIALFSVLRFIRTGEVCDMEAQVLLSISSGGILPVAWFLFTYCVILLVAPWLYRLFSKKKILFYIMVSVFVVAFIVCDLGQVLIMGRPQALWIHLYGTYFVVGMCLERLGRWGEKNRGGYMLV